MDLDQRCIALLTKVAFSTSPVSMDELMEDLHVSKRTIYYDVQKINDWLEMEKVGTLQYERSSGFFILPKAKKVVQDKLTPLQLSKHYDYSPKERIAWASLLIVARESKIFLSTLMEQLGVSRSTLLNDLKQLKNQLMHFSVSLKFHKRLGYYMDGEEINIRKGMMYFLSQVKTSNGLEKLLDDAQNQPNLIGSIFTNYSTFYQCIYETEKLVGVHYTDETVQSLSIQLSLLLKRFTRRRYVQMDSDEKEVIEKTKEFQAASYIHEKIECAFGISLPQEETFYISTYLLGAKISQFHAQHYHSENRVMANMKRSIALMVDDFQKYGCVFFQNRKELEKNLFLHLKPAYYRIKYGVQLDHPLSKTLKESYRDLFLLTKKVIVHVEQSLGITIPEDEIAYVTMHFGGWLDQEGVKVEQRKKALIVCPSGIGTSRILQKQIEELLPNVDVVKVVTVREYDKINVHDIDFVITTTPIIEKHIPVYIVNPILTASEKTFLLKELNVSTTASSPIDMEAILRIVKKHAHVQNEDQLTVELLSYFQKENGRSVEVKYKPMLKELLTVDKIRFKNKVDHWEDALKEAAKPLLEDESITEDYVNAMIQNVKEMGPYIVIAPGFALPHSRPEDGVRKLGMSFLQLKEKCSFSEKEEHQVNLIIVLAAIDNETHLRALSQLSKLLSNQANIEQLKKAETPMEVYELMKQYSVD
ncbi:BglG family transcription antiterminator [Bacillus kexueae]|uniref:BglG family transcription antiterminator n=1 Tax=Aeribacillus kexueae TaxID=2078952 RepID=UPI001FAEA157|nr:BglG family transcription antiterminator [Bacillus kexueae]